MKLFDEVERKDYGSPQYAEPSFTYLNRTARTELDRIRLELEEWFSRYSTPEQAELRSRFRSDITSQHRAAFFELFLHELFSRLDCQITPHPSIPNVATTPDFLVESSSGDRFYVEATLATNQSAAEVAARARMNIVYDILNRVVDSPNFFLWLNVEGAPATPPPAKRIASFLNARLAELDPVEIARLYETGQTDAIPIWRFEHEGWEIEFEPVPKKPGTRGKHGVGPIGGQSTGVRKVDYTAAIRDAIVDKAGRYGELDLPYVVAVNPLELIKEFHIIEALYGKEHFTTIFAQSGPARPIATQISRIPDGAWTGPSGPRHTRVSAVLIVSQLSIWNIPRANLRLYHNPWAKRPYRSEFTQLPQAALVGDRIEQINGESVGAILDLPETWPEGEG